MKRPLHTLDMTARLCVSRPNDTEVKIPTTEACARRATASSSCCALLPCAPPTHQAAWRFGSSVPAVQTGDGGPNCARLRDWPPRPHPVYSRPEKMSAQASSWVPCGRLGKEEYSARRAHRRLSRHGRRRQGWCHHRWRSGRRKWRYVGAPTVCPTHGRPPAARGFHARCWRMGSHCLARRDLP